MDDMDLGLNGKVALVTGSSSGLGLAIARELAQEGTAVAMVARRGDELERHAADISAATPGRAVALVADLREREAPARVAAEAERALGPVDILLANAGGPPAAVFATTREEQYAAALELNLMASVRLAQACVPGMRERKWGRVIFLSSMAAKQPIPGLLLSNTARSGLLGFAKTLATEVARDNVLVNTVLPGHFDTARAIELARARAERENRSVEDVLRDRLTDVPLGRAGEPPELAAVVAFLASSRATFLTGAAIQVDGGQIVNLL
jgi:3-oxoacyl-[acyl-carrier protein] reductase